MNFATSFKYSRFTHKFLVGCAPSGEITFISQSYGGRTTDSELTVKSGFINLVEPGDLVMADKVMNFECLRISFNIRFAKTFWFSAVANLYSS